jgi:uncharacterized membrane protein YebE (DUF533 family)
MLGGLMGGASTGGSAGGGLGGLLGGLTGGSQAGGAGAGGLGGMLGNLMGGSSAGGASSGGLGDLLSGLSGQQGGSGGLGGLLSSLGGGAAVGGAAAAATSPDFGAMFNSALQGNEPEQVSDQDEKNAAVLLRAMISAAKADGQMDADEQRKITEHLGEITQEEADFVRSEMQAPLDLTGLIADVPPGLEQQVYLMSLMAISLDTKEEAVYLDTLRQGLNLTQEASNEIHDKLGAPKLYA